MKFILGQKKYMTQIFNDNGDVMPVTLISAGPCPIVRLKKSEDKDGYNAVVLGLAGKKKLSKRELGQTKGLGNLEYQREFRTDELNNFEVGKAITVSAFDVGDKVKIAGISKGKGFQGVVKRHGFHGHKATHGTKDQVRSPGSIGAGGVQRVFPGTRMAGQMGNTRVTVKNLVIAKIDPEKNELYIRGAVPGAKGSLLELSCPGQLKIEKVNSVNTVNTVNQVNSVNPEQPANRTADKIKIEEQLPMD